MRKIDILQNINKPLLSGQQTKNTTWEENLLEDTLVWSSLVSEKTEGRMDKENNSL